MIICARYYIFIKLMTFPRTYLEKFYRRNINIKYRGNHNVWIFQWSEFIYQCLLIGRCFEEIFWASCMRNALKFSKTVPSRSNFHVDPLGSYSPLQSWPKSIERSDNREGNRLLIQTVDIDCSRLCVARGYLFALDITVYDVVRTWRTRIVRDATVPMTGTWRDSTSITLLIRFTAGSKDRSIAAHLVVARKMGGKVGLICGSCWSGKYSTYKSVNYSISIFESEYSIDPLWLRIEQPCKVAI